MSTLQTPSRKLAALCFSCLLLLIFALSYLYLMPSTASFAPRNPWSGPPLSGNTRISEPALSPERNLLDDASNATLGFEKIFVINLPSRTDRRDLTALSAAFTGIQVEYVDGVTEVAPKAWPPGTKDTGVNTGSLAAWRAHLNVVRMIVEQNISSALILEDDVDWDIRIKSQMRDFAKASRLLVQPLEGTTDRYLDPTWPRPDAEHQNPIDFDVNEASTGEPTTSPYGDIDRWDILWLGHCGCRFPWADDENAPLGRVVIPNDPTVPARKHINIEFGDTQLLDQYPDHTRVVSRSRVNTCTLAYAVTQAGARQMLYELGIVKFDGTYDMMMRSLCQGSSGRELMTCLSPQPGLFNHHRPVGARSSWSDIGEGNDQAWNDVPLSTNIRWASRVNLPRMMRGRTDYIDSYPDDK